MSEVKKIYEALVKIEDSLMKTGIAKSKQTTGGGNYKYRGIDQVYEAVSPLLVENKVIIRPMSIVREEDSQAGKFRLVRLMVTYQAICAEDGSTMEFMGIGEGCDTSDKAAGKALSYAYKTALFQLFAIPVEGQDDTDSVVHEVEQPFVKNSKLKKIEQLESEIVNCFSNEDLRSIGGDIAKLGLDEKDPVLGRLRQKWTAQKQLIEKQVKQI